jgi:hypothetical protein
MSAIMTEAIRNLTERDDRVEAANRRLIARIRNAPDLGTHGKITWTRDEIHER